MVLTQLMLPGLQCSAGEDSGEANKGKCIQSITGLQGMLDCSMAATVCCSGVSKNEAFETLEGQFLNVHTFPVVSQYI